jgi:PAS domain S-box-containing protein
MQQPPRTDDTPAAEPALRESDDRFGPFMEHLPGLAWIKDLHGRYVYANQAAMHVFGAPRAELCGKTDDDLFPPATAAQFRENDRQALASGTGVQVVETLKHADGTVHHSIVSKFPIPGPDGRPAFVGGMAIDITDLKRAEAALRESEARKAAVLETALDCLITMDHEGRVVEFNPAAERTFGYPRPEAVGRPLAELIVPPALRERHRQGLRRYLATGESAILNRRLEMTALRADGREFPVELTVARIPTDGPPLFTAHLRDISDRERAERLRNARLAVTQVLVQSSTLHEAAPGLLRAVCEGLDWAFGALWRVDQAAGVMRCEEAWHAPAIPVTEFQALTERYCFAPGVGLPGRVWASGRPAWIPDVGADDNFPRAPAALRDGLRGAFAFPVLLGGKILAVLEFFSPEVREPDDDLLEMMTGIGGKIGLFIERQRAEARLRHSERVSRFLAEASAALAGLTDYESTLRQVAWLAVPFFADWCAVDLVEPDGSVRRLAVAHADPDKVRLVEDMGRRHPPSTVGERGIPLVLRTGQPDLMEEVTDDVLVQGARSDEHLSLLRSLGLKSAVCVPLQVRGRTLGALTLAMAESGRRYTRSDLALALDLARRAAVAIDNARLYHDLREADRKKDEFLATLAHELRNPLAPIRNTLALLKMKGASAAVVGQARDMMERQLNHLVRLVDDLMDVSRIMRGKIVLRKDAVDLATVVTRAAEIANPMIDAQGHQLTIDLPPEPVRVEGDEIRLAQVVANLLNNAARYADRPGRIWLTGRREGADVVLRVKDQGVGIAPEMLPRVFDLFAQAARAGERSQGGLGIGLSLCQRLVQMHGGTITAHSEGLGKGSEFVVRLPALADAPPAWAEESPAPAEARPPSPRRRVLCVDDNIDACTSLALMVCLHHHDVETAHDGLAALEKAVTFRPDLILLDIGLPGLNGYEVCRRLRQEPALANAFIVALTGWGQDEDRRRSYEAGFDRHVTKPIDPQLLEDFLRGPPGR